MPRILFVKTSSLGDVVHNCPAVSDVARALPGAEIDWVIEESFARVAALHSSVRRVIPVAVRRWRNAVWRPAVWAEILGFRRTLRERRYDCVIDTQSLLKSALLAGCSIGEKHGLDGASARESLAAAFYDVTHRVPKGLHAVERNRRLAAAALGLRPDAAVEYGLRAGGPGPRGSSAPVILLTMTSRADKLWPEQQWVELGRRLACPVVLPWGGARERARAERIAAQLGQSQVPPRMTIDELARLFASAKAVVGLDTGLTHLAAALGAQTVGIYAGSDPSLTGLHGMPRAKNVGAQGRSPAVDDVLEGLA